MSVPRHWSHLALAILAALAPLAATPACSSPEREQAAAQQPERLEGGRRLPLDSIRLPEGFAIGLDTPNGVRGQ